MMRQAAVPGRTRRFPQGFTLIELLVVVAIAAILLTVGVPSYLTTISGYRVANETNALVGDLQYARSEAIKQGVTVSMCISTDGATCSASTNHWEAGHIGATVMVTLMLQKPEFKADFEATKTEIRKGLGLAP